VPSDFAEAGLTPRSHLTEADEVVDDMADLVAAVARLLSAL
jgi:hypothetical protein